MRKIIEKIKNYKVGIEDISFLIVVLVTVLLVSSLSPMFSTNKYEQKDYIYTGFVERIEFLDVGADIPGIIYIPVSDQVTVVYFSNGYVINFDDHQRYIPTSKNVTFYFSQRGRGDRYILQSFEIHEQN